MMCRLGKGRMAMKLGSFEAPCMGLPMVSPTIECVMQAHVWNLHNHLTVKKRFQGVMRFGVWGLGFEV